MSAMATRISISFLLRYFPLEPHSTGTVVDVGGGSGTVSIGLAPYFPKVHFVVEDMPSVISSSKIPVGLQGHLDFEEYDMFNPQPIQGANVYYFRNIFHNWPDEACIKILRNHAVAMRPGSKLVIDDFTLHEPLSLNPWDERRRRYETPTFGLDTLGFLKEKR
jgi:SAM-dependent methyltransferase